MQHGNLGSLLESPKGAALVQYARKKLLPSQNLQLTLRALYSTYRALRRCMVHMLKRV